MALERSALSAPVLKWSSVHIFFKTFTEIPFTVHAGDRISTLACFSITWNRIAIDLLIFHSHSRKQKVDRRQTSWELCVQCVKTHPSQRIPIGSHILDRFLGISSLIHGATPRPLEHILWAKKGKQWNTLNIQSTKNIYQEVIEFTWKLFGRRNKYMIIWKIYRVNKQSNKIKKRLQKFHWKNERKLSVNICHQTQFSLCCSVVQSNHQ